MTSHALDEDVPILDFSSGASFSQVVKCVGKDGRRIGVTTKFGSPSLRATSKSVWPQ